MKKMCWPTYAECALKAQGHACVEEVAAFIASGGTGYCFYFTFVESSKQLGQL